MREYEESKAELMAEMIAFDRILEDVVNRNLDMYQGLLSIMKMQKEAMTNMKQAVSLNNNMMLWRINNSIEERMDWA